VTYSRHTNEDVIAAYRSTGSVWATGRQLGLSGQTVHGRLKALGYEMGAGWSEAECQRLTELSGMATIGQIADEMGRSYASIACKISELGVGTRHGNRAKTKVPRGAGFDKVSVKNHLTALESNPEISISRYAKQQGVVIDTLVAAIEKHFPDWWIAYRNARSDLDEAICPACEGKFYPSNTRQTFCTRRCQSRYRVDQSYFGGKRNTTIGLAEGVCQVCGKAPSVGLSSHHVLGKENDLDNDFLVALCRGCHQLVTLLGGRNFEAEHWEALVSLAWLRKHGGNLPKGADTVHVTVDIDVYEDEDE